MSANELLEKTYLNEKEVAQVIGRAISTLRNERFLRKGLPYLRVGARSIRYKSKDVIAYMEGRRVSFEEDAK
jgi:hypothetical protein